MEWAHRSLAYGRSGLKGSWQPDTPSPVAAGDLIACAADDNPTWVIDAPGSPPRPVAVPGSAPGHVPGQRG